MPDEIEHEEVSDEEWIIWQEGRIYDLVRECNRLRQELVECVRAGQRLNAKIESLLEEIDRLQQALEEKSPA